LTAQLATENRMLQRAESERAEREARIARLELTITHDQQLIPVVRGVIEAIDGAAEVISHSLGSFEAALVADRQAGEHVAGELRSCAAHEATLHAQLQRENESLTEAEVRLQRARDQDADARAELQALATRLELAAEPAEEELTEEERASLRARVERLERRREQLGPVNPLAQEEYDEALAHVEELEAQRADLETALRELEKLIADTDRQIRETFERTFEATARNFEELAGKLFPGGKGRLRLVTERDGPARVLGGQSPPAAEGSDADGAGDELEEPDRDPEEDLLGVEIEITPAGKECKRLTLLSGGEKSMTALAFLFSVFLARPCPFYILDEVEAALDDLNIDRFLTLLRTYSSRAQFIVVTHQKRTMEAADSLYGVSMGGDGISKVISRRLDRDEAA
jgi:chromosome segregation protein